MIKIRSHHDWFNVYNDNKLILKNISAKDIDDIIKKLHETNTPYDLYLKDFFRQINKPIKNITTNDIRVYLYKVQTQRGLSNRSLDSRRTIINAFFEWCCNEEYVDRNPCRTIKKIKYETKERKPLTAIELEQLRDACDTSRDKKSISERKHQDHS